MEPAKAADETPALTSTSTLPPSSWRRVRVLFAALNEALKIISLTNAFISISTVDESDLVSIIVLPTKEPEVTPPDTVTSNVLASPRVNVMAVSYTHLTLPTTLTV